MTATDYLAQPCPQSFPPIARRECWHCRIEDATELLALRERAAQWDGKARIGTHWQDCWRAHHACACEEIDRLREVLHEFAVAGIERDSGKYLVVQISHETMAEARRLTR